MAVSKTEEIVTWYLRFNGYFTMTNFTVHPATRNGGTDADVLAVRFPNSVENPGRHIFTRDPELIQGGVIDFVIAEVKSGSCDLNDTWINSDNRNVEYALKWMGFSEDDSLVNTIADSIYSKGFWRSQTEDLLVRFVCFGRYRNTQILTSKPDLKQITYEEMVVFLSNRFKEGCCQIHRENWPDHIQEFARRVDTGTENNDLLTWLLEKD